MSERLDQLREMLAIDPDDLLARYLAGKECLSEGLLDEAVEHLSVYVSRFEGDKGAACLDLARALEGKGRRADALDALRAGLENAKAHRHMQLTADIEEEIARLGPGG